MALSPPINNFVFIVPQGSHIVPWGGSDIAHFENHWFKSPDSKNVLSLLRDLATD